MSLTQYQAPSWTDASSVPVIFQGDMEPSSKPVDTTPRYAFIQQATTSRNQTEASSTSSAPVSSSSTSNDDPDKCEKLGVEYSDCLAEKGLDILCGPEKRKLEDSGCGVHGPPDPHARVDKTASTTAYNSRDDNGLI
jgi:hypothetical protein